MSTSPSLDNDNGECTPVRMSVSDSYVFDSNKNVDITVADIYDFTTGIKDRSVFTPPSSCDKGKKIEVYIHIVSVDEIKFIYHFFVSLQGNYCLCSKYNFHKIL
jgi:hypothetical protein